MGAVVLETLSTKKLVVVLVLLLLVQVACFLVGGLISPSPTMAQQVIGTACLKDSRTRSSRWYWSRGNGSCEHVDISPSTEGSFGPNDIVFVFQYPLPRDDTELAMSRWFYFHATNLLAHIKYSPLNPLGDNSILKMKVRVGSRSQDDSDGTWHELPKLSTRAGEFVERKLTCTPPQADSDRYECDLLSFFEVSDMHDQHYLINIELPTYGPDDFNQRLGTIEELIIIWFSQTGGFTMVWFVTKTVFTALLVPLIIWYWNRIAQLPRSPVLLERMIFALAAASLLLNLPIEWFTLVIKMPFITLWSDIRQGIFYAVLFSFWIIFTGEHIMDDTKRSTFQHYYKHVTAVIVGSACLLIFELCERGVQLAYPYHSIWSTTIGSKLAIAFIGVASAAGIVYSLLLLVMVVKVFRNLYRYRSLLPTLSKARRLYYQRIIYRFNFLLVLTVICAMMTVASYLVGQLAEAKWKWEEDLAVEYTSAFMIGVYGMWNIYVAVMLSFYAPSHKNKGSGASADENGEESEQIIELTATQSAAAKPSVLSALVTKSATE